MGPGKAPGASDPKEIGTMITRIVLALGATLALTAPLGAQGPPDRPRQLRRQMEPAAESMGRGQLRRPVGPRVEQVLRLRREIGLNEEQVSRLEVIRKDVVEERSGRLATLLDRRSQLAAGDITPDDFRNEMERERAELQQRAGAYRDRLNAVLTEPQRQQLRDLQIRQLEGRIRALEGSRGGRFGDRGWTAGPRGRGGRLLSRRMAPAPRLQPPPDAN